MPGVRVFLWRTEGWVSAVSWAGIAREASVRLLHSTTPRGRGTLRAVSAISLQHLTKVYRGRRGAEAAALRDLSLEVREGELIGLVGPSGSGKTTTLRLIAGLEEPDAGGVMVGGRPMAGVPPHERGVALVLQDHPLFPHLTVEGNLALGLRLRRLLESEVAGRIREVASLLGLEGLLDRRPEGLSGGERQRVALGAALAKRPRCLLLDEPMAQLDAPLRVQLRGEIRRLQQALGVTMVLVTHDQAEAMAIADRLALLHGGELQQVGSPRELYQRPDNTRVAQFLGVPPMNLVPGRWDRQGGDCIFVPGPGSGWRLPSDGLPTDGDPRREVLLGIRPEAVGVAGEAEPGGSERSPGWAMEVEAVEDLASEWWLRLRQGGVRLLARRSCPPRVQAGDRVRVWFPAEALHWFDAGTGWRL